jgi:hypothetical protein
MWKGRFNQSINLITATGSVPLENYLTTVGNVGSKFASAQFADTDDDIHVKCVLS